MVRRSLLRLLVLEFSTNVVRISAFKVNPIDIFKTALANVDSIVQAQELIEQHRELVLKGAPGFLKASLVYHLINSGKRVLWIAPRSAAREQALSDLSQLLDDEMVGYLPAPMSKDDISPFETRIFRARALQHWTEAKPFALITEPSALWLELLPSREELDQIRILLQPNIDLGRDSLAEKLANAGYQRCDMVENRGDYALRGHILDIFPYTHDAPLRLEFWGDRLDSIRKFDPGTQRTIAKLQSESLFLSNIKGEGTDSFQTYLTENDIIFLEEPEDARLMASQSGLAQQWDDILGRQHIVYSGSPKQELPRINLGGIPQEDFGGHIGRFSERLTYDFEDQIKIFISCENQGQIDRLKELLSSRNLPESPIFLQASISGGFRIQNSNLALFTDHQIFRRPRRRRTYFRLRNFSPIDRADTLKRGDYVVHEDYGIGRYVGLNTIQVGGHQRECLQIEYAGNTTLYVRLEALKRVQKYSGREGFTPPLTRIGRGEWDKIRKRARKAVKELATDLLKLYALRASSKGYAFPKDDAIQLELEARFEFEETPDQMTAIDAVKQDMEEPKPMDRLVCGDVGYGKTEVALRAAFKAVIAGKQVGVLVPTTLLAQQHFNTFIERMQDSPIEIEMLSRFRTQKEQKQVLELLLQGKIDIVIGTHRLLSKDVRFKKLGLLIIDEEHRFGVRHKEKIKSLKTQIDVLTLTATPIPRTLHLALIGARDMSLIKTAPQDRLPIETEIAPFSEELITEAIIREIDRGGQVYFVHNRVQSIVPIKDMLQRWMPEVRFVVGHGQMPERHLEETMTDFLMKKYDVLVSTMIIESGLDLPNVNTMIINRADRFGLAQLYQLRGRIGRSNRQAFAYLLTPPKLSVSDPARKRLEAIRDCSYLGAGFQLAMHDLEIRGAGDIFGAKQSGFIHAVGFDLYQKMLSESILELKQDSNLSITEEEKEVRQRVTDPKIDFPFDAYLPTDYIERSEHRVDLYRKLSTASDHLELQSIIEETTDRYGAPPQQAKALFDLIEIKLGAVLAGLPRVIIDENYFLAEIDQNHGEDWSQRLAKLIQNLQGIPVEFAGNEPPEIIYRWNDLKDWQARVAQTKNILRKIA